MLLDSDREVADRFGSPATPGAVLIAADGGRLPFVAEGRDDVERLLEAGLERERAPGLAVGAELSPITLTTLDGAQVALDRPGGETVVLFWNPGCGYCRSLHDDVVAWERERRPHAPGLVIVATDGSDEELRDEGFAAPLARDTGRAVADLFDAHGTPMAVRISADGHVASPLAAGADEVLGLLSAAGSTAV